MARRPDELQVPPAARKDRDAVELARIWIAEGNQHVTLRPEVWEDPANWGIMAGAKCEAKANGKPSWAASCAPNSEDPRM